MEKTKIIVWGCGTRGKNLVSALDKTVCSIVFCDAKKEPAAICVDGADYEKIHPSALADREYDYIFIASKNAAEAIYIRLQDMGIPTKKIVPQNIGQEKLGTLRGLFTLSGYAYLCNLLARDESAEIRQRLEALEADRKLMREYELGAIPKPYVNRVKRIGVVCLDAIPNVTERVISASTRYLLRKVTEDKECELISIDFYHPNYEVISACDAIVFAGGGIIKLNSLKFDFPRLIDNITILADRYSIPVLFVGVGVEDTVYDEEGYLLMQRALNRSCVKVISVRENVEAMQNYILNPAVKVINAADPALFAKEAYELPPAKADSRTIGVGVVNFVNWEREGYPVSKAKLLTFYANLFQELERRGYDWKIFCNGVVGDDRFLQDVCAMNPEYAAHRIKRPETDTEWLETMQGFSGIIAPRLHTNIVAYALGIPCVALVWDQKIKAFADSVKNPAFAPKQFNAVKIVDALERTTVKEATLSKKQKAVSRAVENFVSQYLFPQPEPTFWEKVKRKILRFLRKK